MQLKKRPPICKALAAATCQLLTATAVTAEAAESEWEARASNLVYSETSRVTVNETITSVKKQLNEDESIAVNLTYDSMSGASPTGALPSSASTSQSVTSASGTLITIPGGTQPELDFKDERQAVGVSWDKKLSRLRSLNSTFNFSKENDYTAFGAGTQLKVEDKKRTREWNFGASFSLDSINPIGGVPYGGQRTGSAKRYDQDYKLTVDGTIGITKIISQRSLMQFNFFASVDNGYLNEPYKVLSVVTTAEPDISKYNIFDDRPDLRIDQGLFWRLLYQPKKSVYDLSYRLFSNDWGVVSHTVGFRYRFDEKKHYWQPRFRYYNQSSANFYHYKLLDSDPIPEFASADYRLAGFISYRLGIKYGYKLSADNEVNLRVEYLEQQDKSQRLDTLKAFILQLAAKIRF